MSLFSSWDRVEYTIPVYLALPRGRPSIYYAIPETYKIVENALKIMLGNSAVRAVGSQSEQIEIGHSVGNGPFWGSSALFVGVCENESRFVPWGA